ncbi:heparinase II/III family protein [Arthrobacter sp. UCD-GKA]|uniref:heparinase II/III family protein n=1 Tax=Arthrobacter sp. UCD-GKA TaxID=1913576 RepID=UPI0015879060|nr:heparinase II/III family protein [Arthrobacter sp. UCD-GKA]
MAYLNVGAQVGTVERAKAHRIGSNFEILKNDNETADGLLSGKLPVRNFEPFELPLIPSWEENPFEDRNWQFNYHSLRWIDVLRREFLRTRDRKYGYAYMHYLKSWVERNGDPSRDASSEFAWHDMASSYRASMIAGAITILGAQSWLLHALHEHGTVLADPSFGTQRGNHALHVKTGLLIAGDVLNNIPWKKQALERIGELLDESIDSQGVDLEGAMSYQWSNFVWYRNAQEHLLAANMDLPPVFNRLALMPEFVAFGTPPTRRPVRFGDSDTSVIKDYPDPTVQFVRTQGKAGTKPASVYRKYDAGYIFSRSSWTLPSKNDSLFYSLRFGPSKKDTSHGQHDGGSMTLSIGDATFVDENGRYKYQKHEFTSFLASNRAHNSLVFSDIDYNVYAETALIKSESSANHDWTVVERQETSQSSWRRGVFHNRNENYLVVIDAYTNAGKNGVSQLWQLPNQADVKIGAGFSTVSMKGVKQKLRIHSFSSDPADTKLFKGDKAPLMGWRSEKYGTVEAAPCLAFSSERANGLFVTVFSVEGLGKKPMSHSVEFDGNGKATVLGSVSSVSIDIISGSVDRN